MTQSLAQAMQAFTPALPLAVGLSGGADSTALLLACAQKWPGQVHAFHVNHGLQEAAGRFEAHCKILCARLQVPLQVSHINAGHAPGQSPEDAARIARYKAFDALALIEHTQEAIKSIAIAQHADDQVETVLLALSRGAGMAGLSAMPLQWQRQGISYHRPLLGVGSAAIRHWLAQRSESFVEDPSNTDERFTRNRIRARLLPVLEAVFPQFRDTFARTASHAAQAQELLDVLARQDLLATSDPVAGAPLIAALQRLGSAQQANALRYWLKSRHQVIPSSAQLAELVAQIQACTTRGHHIHIKVGDGFVQRLGEVLNWYNLMVLLSKN
jgi:tRNA(Ile)-lysidine synthase